MSRIKRIVIFVFILVISTAFFLSFMRYAPLFAQIFDEEQKQKIFTVRGNSLAPRVSAGAKMLLTHPDKYQRNDIVMARLNEQDNVLAKIIKAVPGDIWSFKEGLIYVNGSILENSRGEQYKINSEILEMLAEKYKIIPEDSYLLLGDLPSGSIDSSRFGFVYANQIMGVLVPLLP